MRCQALVGGKGGPGGPRELRELGELGEDKPAQGGWLDRVVLHLKNKFYQDIERTLPDIEIKAEIQPIPPGEATDDQHDVWDEASVLRLAALLRRSSAAPLRRLMEEIDKEIEQPSRRRYAPLKRSRQNARRRQQRRRPVPARRGDLVSRPSPSKVSWSVPPVPDQELWAIGVGQSHLFFPKIKPGIDQYYDHDEAEYDFVNNWSPGHESADHIDLNKRIYIMNPVEARLPGRYIKIGLLKTILKERAMIAKMLPSSVHTRTWPPVINVTEILTTEGHEPTNFPTEGDNDNISTSSIPANSTTESQPTNLPTEEIIITTDSVPATATTAIEGDIITTSATTTIEGDIITTIATDTTATTPTEGDIVTTTTIPTPESLHQEE